MDNRNRARITTAIGARLRKTANAFVDEHKKFATGFAREFIKGPQQFGTGIAEGIVAPALETGTRLARRAGINVPQYKTNTTLVEEQARNYATLAQRNYDLAFKLRKQGNKVGAQKLEDLAKTYFAEAQNLHQKEGERLQGVERDTVIGAGRTALTTLGAPRALSMAGAKMLPIASALGGTVNTLQGGEFSEGAGAGAARGTRILGVTRFTDPVIFGVAGKTTSSLGIMQGVGKQLLGRTVTGLGNVVEDEIIGRLEGIEQGLADHALSFGLGFILSGSGKAEDWDELTKRLKDTLRNPLGGQQVEDAVKAIRRQVEIPDNLKPKIAQIDQAITNANTVGKTGGMVSPAVVKNNYTQALQFEDAIRKGQMTFEDVQSLLDQNKTNYGVVQLLDYRLKGAPLAAAYESAVQLQDAQLEKQIVDLARQLPEGNISKRIIMSAPEFADRAAADLSTNNTVYRAVDSNNGQAVLGKGKYVVFDPANAAQYGKDVQAFKINPEAKIADLTDPARLQEFTDLAVAANKQLYTQTAKSKGIDEAIGVVMRKYAQDLGFDGIKSDDKVFGSVVFNEKMLVPEGKVRTRGATEFDPKNISVQQPNIKIKGGVYDTKFFRGEGGSNQFQGKTSFAEGRNFATDINRAKQFGNVQEFRLNPTAKVKEIDTVGKDLDVLAKELGISESDILSPRVVAEKLKAQGYDAIVYKTRLAIEGKITDQSPIVTDAIALTDKAFRNVQQPNIKIKGGDEGSLDPEAELSPAERQGGFISLGAEVGTPKQLNTQVRPATPAVNNYAMEQIARQEAESAGDALGIRQKLQGVAAWMKDRFVDNTAALYDTLNTAAKKGNYVVLPKDDINYQIDRVLYSNSIATQFLKDNELDKVIQQTYADDTYKMFNQYLISKQAIDVAERGFETGRNVEMDRKLVAELGEQFEPLEAVVHNYSYQLKETAVQAGLISRQLSDALDEIYPNYVPLNRVFSEMELEAMNAPTKGGGPASISTQSVIKRLKGSERAIQDPLESMVVATQSTIHQVERNIAAKQLISYANLPGNPFNLRKMASGESTVGKHTVSAIVDGKKVTYETDKRIAEAAKNLNHQQWNIITKIVNYPVRVLKAGAVGVNIPFVMSNLVRDQFFSGVTTGKTGFNSVLHPGQFTRAFMAALRGGDLYDDWMRTGSSFTSFDISRQQANLAVDEIASGANAGSKVKYLATHPTRLLRAVEDIIGTTEEVTRLQNFEATRRQLLSQGRTAQDATILAGQTSRFGSANFLRHGDFGQAVNAVAPFVNAGVQGARSLSRSFKNSPKQTTARFVTTIAMPIAVATVYNLSDPKRKAAYDDIAEYEKENNLILLPPNPTQDEKGQWNAIKIPVTPGLSNLMSSIRRQIEGVYGYDNKGFTQIAKDLFAATTSLELDQRKLLSNFTPQLIKPSLESTMNQNLFTGRTIVPEYMKSLPTEMQAYDETSGTARILGRATNTAPLVVENTISTAGGGVGRQIMNLSDRTLNALGIIPSEQVGGEDPFTNLARRFTKARGGEIATRIYEEADKVKTQRAMENKQIKAAYLSGNTEEFNRLTQGRDRSSVRTLIRNADERALKDTLSSEELAIYNLTDAELQSVMQNQPELGPTIQKVMGIKNQGTGAFGNLPVDSYELVSGVDEVVAMPETTGYQKAIKQKAAYTKAMDVLSDDLVPASEKPKLIERMGLDPVNVEYYSIAKQDNDLKYQFVLDSMVTVAQQTRDRSQFLRMLGAMRSRVNGSMIASDGVIDDLYEAGYLTEKEKKAFKDLEVNGLGQPEVKTTGRGRSAKVKAIKTKVIKAPASATKIKAVSL